MIKGYAQRRIDKYSWDIGLIGEKFSYTFEIKKHSRQESLVSEISSVRIDDEEAMATLRALSEALQEMGLFPQNAVQSELKATKYHLEDMRKMVDQLLP